MSEDRYRGASYSSANPDYHVSDSEWKASQVRAILADEGIVPSRVGDVGCGAGEVLRCLSQWLPNAAFEGWDVSPAAIELARTRAGDRLSFFLGDPFQQSGGGYDVLLCLDVLEHVADYLGFLRALRSRAAAFVFHIPLDLSVQSILRVYPMRRDREQLGHLHYFTKETAIATLESVGYDIVSWRYTAGSLHLKNRSALQFVARVPRRLAFGVAPDWAVRLLGGFSLLVLAR